MKKYLIIVLLVLSNTMFAQKSLDTIYANDKKNVALFFPNPIKQGITGVEHFVFTFNRENGQYFGLLQATPGEESNLLTVTNNGQVYSYILRYAEKLPKLNYFISKDESIGNERPVVITQNKEKVINHYKHRVGYFQRASEYLLKSKQQRISIKRKKGIKLELQKMVYDGSEVFLVIEIENNSGINFEIDFLNIYKTNGNRKRKSSFQRLQQGVIYKYELPITIRNGLHQRFVYVLPKFVLGDNEKLMIELQELKGSRSVFLETGL